MGPCCTYGGGQKEGYPTRYRVRPDRERRGEQEEVVLANGEHERRKKRTDRTTQKEDRTRPLQGMPLEPACMGEKKKEAAGKKNA